MIIPIRELDKYGIVRDIPDHELPVNAFSDGDNVRFGSGAAAKMRGHELLYDPPSVAPYFLLPINDPISGKRFWIYAGLTAIYVNDATGHTDISRAVGGAYNASADNDWSGGYYNGFAILNNPGDDPQEWGLDTGTPCADLTNWPASTSCGIMRPFKNFLVAGYITKSGTEHPTLVKWSHEATSGSVPSSWDETDATVSAGEKTLGDTPGQITDMLPLGDINVIYKRDAVVLMQHIGGIFIFSFLTVSREFGLYSRNSVVSLPRPHIQVAFGIDDIIVHSNGRDIRSIADRRLRSWVLNNIEDDEVAKSFVFHNVAEHEVWVCFVPVGETAPKLALTWNWEENSWGTRELNSVSHGASGILDPARAARTYTTYGAGLTYDSAGEDYHTEPITPLRRRSVLASGVNTELYELDQTFQFDGVNYTSRLERTGLAFVADRFGRLSHDPDSVKLAQEVWLHIKGTGTVDVSVGAQMVPNGAITWDGPFTFTIGSDRKVNPWISGRLLAVKIESTDANWWELQGLDIVQEIVGTGGYS